VADKYAVYSDDATAVDLAQILSPRRAVTVPWVQFTFAGGTTETIPSSGDVAPEAADKVVFYETGLSSGSGSRTLKLPQTPVDGQLIIIKDTSAGSSNLIIERFDSSDSIDGAASYTLQYNNQAIVVRPTEVTSGVWAWSILSEYRTPALLMQMQWGGSYFASDFPVPPDSIYLPVGFENPGGTPPSSLQHGLISVDAAGLVSQFILRLIGNTLDAGDSLTFNLRKNGSTQMTLGPYSGSTATGTYTTTTGAFAVAQGDLLTVECAYTALAGSGSISVIGACVVAV